MLPEELVLRIFSYLDPASLTRAAQVYKMFQRVAADQSLWKRKLEQHFPNVYNTCQHENIDWSVKFRDTYQEEYAGLILEIRGLLSCVKEDDIQRLRKRDLSLLTTNPLLLLKAAQGHQEILDFFFAEARGFCSKMPEGISRVNVLLQWAIRCHQSTAIKELIAEARTLDRFFDINAILRWTVEAGYALDIDTLVSQGADVNMADDSGKTALHFAAEHKRADVVNALLVQGAAVNAATHDGSTPLHLAADHGGTAVVKTLLAKGATVDAVNSYGRTPLHRAVRYGHTDVVNMLLNEGADVHAVDNSFWTPLHRAACGGHVSVINALLAQGASVDVVNNERSTPLHMAANSGNDSAVKALLAKGAVVDAVDSDGCTPLHRATNVDVVNELLNQGATVNVLDNCRETPLHKAAHRDHVPVINALLVQGAAVHAINRNGWTPLHVAARCGSANAAKALLVQGAKVNAVDSLGSTALHFAAQWGFVDVVNALLDHGADIYVVDGEGKTALGIASLNIHPHVAIVIENAIRNQEFLNRIQASHTSMVKPIIINLPKPSPNKQRLKNYINARNAAPKYKKTFTLFCKKFNLGCSRTEKVTAANALWNFLYNGAPEDTLQQHTKALNNGELGSLCRSLRPRR